MAYAVITENDESQWDDETGVLYHFPKRYAAILTPGVQVVYYKGKQRKASYAATRISPSPHYFGLASVARVFRDKASGKGDLFATIEDFVPFSQPVPIALDGEYLEAIPESRIANYWRDGVRPIDANAFERIASASGSQIGRAQDSDSEGLNDGVDDLESALEGSMTLKFVRTYERIARYRRQAIAIHGLRCRCCDLDMGEVYGALGQGLIHVHHIVPVSEFDAPKKIDPATDLVPVCPNCHAVIHHRKSSTISIDELRAALGKS